MAFAGKFTARRTSKSRVEADIHYLENWSFGLDVIIIFKTIKQCVVPPNYGLLKVVFATLVSPKMSSLPK